MIRTKSLALLPILAALAACAGEPPPPPLHMEEPGDHGEGGPRGGGGRGGPGGLGRGGGALNLFVSPAGKPYRGKPGEPYPSAAWFAEADADHDGRLSLAEFRADAEKYFRELDTDHDGVVDGFEITAYEHSLPEMLPELGRLDAGEGQNQDLTLPEGGRRGRGGGGGPGGGGGGRRGGGGGGGGMARMAQSAKGGQRQGAGLFSFLDQPEPVTVADTDFNGRISLQEQDAAADRRFEILDTNKDGYLTLAELPKTPVQLFAEREAARRAKRGGGDGPRPPPPPGN